MVVKKNYCEFLFAFLSFAIKEYVYDRMIYDINPVRIPSQILPVIDMSRMVRNAGIDSRLNVTLMCRTTANIKNPATTMAGAVADVGMARKMGENTRLTAKHRAVTSADTPVRPPSAKPVELSTNVVTGLQPKQAPDTVARASLSIMLRIWGIRPFLRMIPALAITPTTVPRVSNTSKNSIVVTHTQKSGHIRYSKSN